MARRAHTIREVEIKLRIADLPALLQKLRGLGVRSGSRVLEQNVLYDTPESDFRRRGQLLRLRIETWAPRSAPQRRPYEFQRARSRAILTSKVPVHDIRPPRFKEKIETEVMVSNPAAWQRAVKKLGLREGFRYEKYRTSVRFSGAHLDLDETFVGNFLEIEGRPAAIDRIARRLGFLPRDYVRATYWDLYVEDCRRRGRKTGNMLLVA